MNLPDRLNQLGAQKQALQTQLDTLYTQGDPLRARIAVLDAQGSLLQDLIAEQAAEQANAPQPTPVPDQTDPAPAG